MTNFLQHVAIASAGSQSGGLTQFLQHVVDALSLGSLYALLALGVALIFGIMNLLNFAYGELIMIGAYSLYVMRDAPFVVQVIGCLAVVVLASVLLERLAFRPVRGADPAVLLVTSFALSFVLQSLAIIVFGARAKGIALPDWLSASTSIGSLQIDTLSIVTVVTAAIVLVSLAFFLQRTPIGVQMRAAAESFSTARLVGVRANRVIVMAFVLSGLLAALAAILIVAQGGEATPTMGSAPVLVAFVATIIGGMGSLSGAVLGGFFLGVLTVVLQVELPLSLRPYRDAFVYGAVLFVLLVRPGGLVAVKTAFQRV
jgi:branched-chain amino acid transport system permease protein